MTGAQLLARQAGADPKRVACWGESYGGYMTMLAITKTPEVCNAGVSLYGVSDWTTFLKQSKRKLWRMRLHREAGRSGEGSSLWNRSAAIHYAAQARSRSSVTQGLDDDGVMPVQGESLYDAMHRLGRPQVPLATSARGTGSGTRAR